jgi:hypothetical protein
MSSEPTLAMTVHHKGHRYRAGMTAEEIGPVATEIGKHAWVDEVAPTKAQLPDEDTPTGGVPAGTPIVPTPSALPTPPAPEPDEEPDTSGEGGDEVAPRKAAGGRRGGNQG